MNPKLKKLAIPALRWTVGLVVLIKSFEEAFDPAAAQHFAEIGLPQWVRAALAGSEIIAAILLIVPFTTVIGGYMLLVIFALAAAIHLLHGQYDIEVLLVYAAAVLVSMTNRDFGTAGVAHDGQ